MSEFWSGHLRWQEYQLYLTQIIQLLDLLGGHLLLIPIWGGPETPSLQLVSEWKLVSKREKILLFESGEKILRKFHLKNQAMTSGSQFPLLGRAPRVEAGLLSRYTTRKPPHSFLHSITSISYAMQWCHNKTWNSNWEQSSFSRFSLAFSSPNRPHKKAQETNCIHN